MALAFYFAPPNKMSAAQYDQCIAQLKAAGAQHPAGRLYHSAFGSSDSLMVYDVWASKEDFDKFGATLMPILMGLGVDPGQPSVMSVHNTIVPPAPKPKAAKKPAKKKAAPKKAKAKAKPKKKAKKR